VHLKALRALRSNSFKRLIRMNVPLYIMFIPAIAFYAIFKYAPMAGAVIAFKSYNFHDGIWGSPWVGLYYFKLIFESSINVQIILNTLKLSLLSLLIGFPFPIILAVCLNEVRKMWFRRFVQTVVYLPHFFSWVVISGMVITLFSVESGFINYWINELFGKPIPFMYQAGSWTAIFVGSGIWKDMGFDSIIFLAALSTINPSLYEVASMDGASRLRQIWNVSLPGISGTIILIFILNLGRVMEVGFDQIYNLQNSAVLSVSEVISTYVYKVGIQKAQFSLTTAIGLFEAVIGLVLVLGANWGARKFDKGLF
jgi:putative aldouronate transport system permease protein